jgi:hypothetical protein
MKEKIEKKGTHKKLKKLFPYSYLCPLIRKPGAVHITFLLYIL